MYRCAGPTPSAPPLPPANVGGLSKNTFDPSLEIAFVVVPNRSAGRNAWSSQFPLPRIAPSGLISASTALAGGVGVDERGVQRDVGRVGHAGDRVRLLVGAGSRS